MNGLIKKVLDQHLNEFLVEIRSFITMVKRFVFYVLGTFYLIIKRSDVLHKLWVSACEQTLEKVYEFVKDVATRWSSTVMMLRRFVLVKEPV